MEPIEPSFESFPQVADEMPPIEDLLGLWGAKGGPTRILCGAVTAQDEDAWMRLEPRSKGIGRAVGPQVDRPMALQVYQQGAIGVPTTNGPIVHPQDGRCRREWIWKLVDELDRLAGNAYGTGRGLPSSWPAGLCSQRLTQGGPRAIVAPSRQGVIHGALGQPIVREPRPLTPAPMPRQARLHHVLAPHSPVNTPHLTRISL